jgi:hypothetical protein
MRVDFSKTRINEVIIDINQKIQIVKNNKDYLPSIQFCDDLGGLVYRASFVLDPLKLDINYNSLAPAFEKIYTEGKVLVIACEQHLEGSTGAFDEYKKAYTKYMNELEEIKNVD